jgi:predicted nucleic acid-binding protein
MITKYLVETDFLFALRPSDKFHKKVLNILENCGPDVCKLFISPASPIEATLVMKSHEMSEEDIINSLKTMDEAIKTKSKPNYLDLTLDNMSLAVYLAKEHSLTLFDSLHASFALMNNLTYYGSDKNLRNVIIAEKGKTKPLEQGFIQ